MYAPGDGPLVKLIKCVPLYLSKAESTLGGKGGYNVAQWNIVVTACDSDYQV